ncbi:alpha,alpha-trehalose-phosphate synthase (UDP-forming) [Falsiroseomonas tokyonensis]|uniref:Trehalose-6-phosphate synthase n=1 Tax=Falsiroseomonas tokyonensis TaxID=430521 RepID=A0ABV7BTH7_9PROT|nr:trehalose-6-phosphate synthase [Falsiroseomonas tokyonensis]MBU8538495.1 trehalose-6-phosphate synthase [Falsiroseomonas tokyonensis]
MSRLVIVANRVPDPKEAGPTAGGLAVALKDALANRDSMYFGWSGKTAPQTGTEAALHRHGTTTYATIDLGHDDYKHFYQGFSNAALWPVLHYRLGIARFDRRDFAGYQRTNAAFAAALAPLLKPDDTIWIHDFHLFLMAAELRALGCKQRIGFFLHVPFPPRSVFNGLPHAEKLLEAMEAIDAIGMQTEDDSENLRAALIAVGKGDVALRVGAFAIGIDASGFAKLAAQRAEAKEVKRLRDSLAGRSLAIGIDRLDYTKGLPQRIAGFGAMLERFPRHRGKITFLQVAPVSRGDVAMYRALRRELDEGVGRINGQMAEPDWAPIRYITRAVPRPTLAGFMRMARIGLVTPLRDGMNLVAKEYVAAQDPADPGVLVLSRFAGAAVELDGALIVNPLDPDDIAEALDAAMDMPADERLDRWNRNWAKVKAVTASVWCRRFLSALEGTKDVADAGQAEAQPARRRKPRAKRAA